MTIFQMALVGALFILFAFWISYALVCFHDALAEEKENPEPPIQDIQEDTTMIRMAVEHLRWKKKRGYLWGGLER